MTEPNFSRRLFLGGLAAMTLAGPARTRTAVPVLWGDMVHDDAPALNALFRGDPIRVLRGRVVQGEAPIVMNARLLVSSPVLIRVDHASIIGCQMYAADDFVGSSVLKIDANNGTFHNCLFDSREARAQPDYVISLAERTAVRGGLA